MAAHPQPSPQLLLAAWELGAVYAHLSQLGYLPLDRWAIAEHRPLNSRLVYALVHVHADEPLTGSTARLPQTQHQTRYLASYARATTEVRKAAASAAQEMLEAEGAVLKRLAARLAAPGIADRLHEAASRVLLNAGGAGMNDDDIRAANKVHGPLDSTFMASRQYDYVRTVRAAGRARVAAALRTEVAEATSERPALDPREMAGAGVRAEVSELLRILFVHPDGVQLLQSYATSPISGAEHAATAVSEAADAAKEFAAELREGDARVWRYPPLVLMGVQHLGLGHVPGFREHMVDLGQVLGRSRVRAVLDDLGMVLFCVGLVFTGPVGAAVLAAADLTLTGAGAWLTYLDEKERQLAVDASAFRAEHDRVATTGGYGGTALAGAASLVSAIGLLGAASKLFAAKGRLHGIEPSSPSGLDVDTVRKTHTEPPTMAELEDTIAAGGNRTSWTEAQLEEGARRRPGVERQGNPHERMSPQKLAANARKAKTTVSDALGPGAPRELAPEVINGSRGTANPLAGPPSPDLGYGEVPLDRLQQEVGPGPSGATSTSEYGVVPVDALTRPGDSLDLTRLERTRQAGRVDRSFVITRELQNNLPDMDLGEYRKLVRRGTPTEELRDWARRQLAPGDADPVIPKVNVDVVHPDHIVAVELIWQFPGFADLNMRAKLEVLNMPENIMAVSRKVNVARSSEPYASWAGLGDNLIPPVQRNHLIDLERELTRKILERINDLLAEQRRIRGTGTALPTVPAGLLPAMTGDERARREPATASDVIR